MVKNAILSSTERRILAVLQVGLPESRTPYKDMAQKIGVETDELLTVLEDWKCQGKLRRIGAIVNHFKVGLGRGAMVVWQVEPQRVKEVGQILAGFEEVSHVYERQTAEKWPYNIYSMVHGKSDKDVQQIIKRMSGACGVSNYRILLTERELKKVPPTYISEQ